MVAARSLAARRPLRRVFSLLLACAAALQAAEITTSLEPPAVPAGQGATLTIRVVGGNVTKLTAADPPPNLILNGPSQGREIRSINGVTTASLTLTYQLGSLTPGDYAIAPFTLVVDGAEVQTEPFQLKVLPSASQAPAGLASGAGTGAPPPAPPTAAQGDFGFLTVELASKSRQHIWVGEIAPVRIQAWIPSEARANFSSQLQTVGSSFTLHHLSDQPQQSVQESQGQAFRVLTWYGGLSATKDGTYPPDLSLKATVARRDPSPPKGNSPFDDLFGRMIQQDVVLRSKTDPSANLEIRPLPEADRPPDFGGAVGKFSFAKALIPSDWRTGEPQSIAAEITGEGNFQLLQQPTLTPAADWKTYSGSTSFAPGDLASFSGTSSFRFNGVPSRAGAYDLHLAFSFFDPDQGRFQTAESAPQKVAISGPDVIPPPPVAAPDPTPAPPPKAQLPAPPRPQDSAVASLRPLVFRPAFHQIVANCAAAALLGLLLRGTRARWANPQRRARAAQDRALRQALDHAASLAQRGDAPGFFAAGRRALQARLATLWQRPGSALALADLAEKLPPDSPVIAFFRQADQAEFSPPMPFAPSPLPEAQALLEQALQSLNIPSGSAASPP